MLPESKNIQTIADNIRSLENQINALDVEIPSHGAADAGKILAVDSEGDLEWKTEYSYTPPAYSTEEVKTGQKWIDGKDIYCKVLAGQFPEITSTATQTVGSVGTISAIIMTTQIIEISTHYYATPYNIQISKASGEVRLVSVPATYSEAYYDIVVYYTKPDPEPSPETKSKKGGNKK